MSSVLGSIFGRLKRGNGSGQQEPQPTQPEEKQEAVNKITTPGSLQPLPDDELDSEFEKEKGTEEDIEQHVMQVLAENHWNSTGITTKRGEEPELYSAEIGTYGYHITITLDKEFEKKQAYILKKSGLDKVVREPERKAIAGVTKHEIGHRNWCPGSVDWAERLMQSAALGLKEAGLNEDLCVVAAANVANMFADVVINGIRYAGNDTEFAEGRALTYTYRAYGALGGKLAKKPTYSDMYALFVDSQLKLTTGNDTVRGIGERYAKDYGTLKDASQKLLATVLGDEHLAKKAFTDSLDADDRKEVVRRLKDRAKWPDRCQEFAKVLAPYVRNEQQDLENMFRMLLQAQIKKSEKEGKGVPILLKVLVEGSGGEGSRKKGEKGEGKEPTPAIPIPCGVFALIVANAAIRKRALQSGIERGSGLDWASKFESMHERYKREAGKIVIDFIREGEEAPRLPLFSMRVRPVGGGESIATGIDWARTRFVGAQRDPVLYKKVTPYELQVDGPKDSGSYEDVLFVLDTSGSMAWSGEAMDGSAYDMCLRTMYAVVNYLEQSGKATALRYGLIQFGWQGKSTFSGWKGYNDLEELCHQAFTGYQDAGETIVDPGKVLAAINTARRGFLTVFATDGAVHNPDEAHTACRQAITKKNDFVVFKIQAYGDYGDNFAEKMKASGAAIVYVKDPKDLIGLTLRVVEAKYAVVEKQSTSQMVRRDPHSALAMAQQKAAQKKAQNQTPPPTPIAT